MSPTFRALSNHNYRLYLAGSVVSNTGTWMQRVAQDWLVLSLPGTGGTQLGITTGLQFLPILLLSPYAGVVADRFPKRALLQVTQACMALASLLLGVVAVTGHAQVWHVYVLAFVFGIGAAFDGPARQSFVSEMVGRDDLTNAVGLNSAAFNAARLLGPAAAGLMIGALGDGAWAAGWVILLNAVSYVAVIYQLHRMDPRLLHSPELRGRSPGMLIEGVRYVRTQPKMMLILVLVFFAGTFGMNFQITSALMATQVYGKGASEFGILGSAIAIGSLSAALINARRVRIRLRLLVIAATAFGAGRDRRRAAADVLVVRAVRPGDRLRHAHPAQLGQRDHAAGVRPGVPGAGDGALHDRGHGRYAARRARHRAHRRAARGPVDPDHRGSAHPGRGRARAGRLPQRLPAGGGRRAEPGRRAFDPLLSAR